MPHLSAVGIPGLQAGEDVKWPVARQACSNHWRECVQPYTLLFSETATRTETGDYRETDTSFPNRPKYC